MCTVPKPYPKEFRDDVVRVARNREPGQHLKQIAADFGISESCLTNWLKTADVEDGVKPGATAADTAELREAKKRIRLQIGRASCREGEQSQPGRGRLRQKATQR